jgi:nucleotide-binding universal stress UspA family protein
MATVTAQRDATNTYRPAIRVILARVDGTSADPAILRHAGRVASLFGAHVRVLHVPAVPPTIQELSGFGPDIAHFGTTPPPDRQRRTEANSARTSFSKWMEASGAHVTTAPQATRSLTCEFVEMDGDEPAVLADIGRLADLIVIPRPTGERAAAQALALEAALFRTERPVLLVPPDAGEPSFNLPIIGWNASPQATRALAAAIPILQAVAAPATILTAREARGREADPTSVVAYLRWHGIAAEVGEPSGGSPGRQLLELARRKDSGFVVCGAYTHSRLRQALFGGVTTELIQASDVPVLMCC